MSDGAMNDASVSDTHVLAPLTDIYEGMVEGVRSGHVIATFAGKAISADELSALNKELREAVHFELTAAGRAHVEALLGT